nr:hypothetical protein GCM10020241_08330 [Streptoalloteichus tenebrarius]
MALGHQALAVCGQPIRSVWQRAHDLRQLTQRWLKDPRVVEYEETLRTWQATPTARAITNSPTPSTAVGRHTDRYALRRVSR